MRVGILGGTFNPIHVGHLLLAECAREQARLDQVWFIPTSMPPHKSSRDLAAPAERLAMVRLAIRNHPAFRVDTMELQRGGVSYTLETVHELRRRHPRAQLFLIVGSEMLRVRWYGLKTIARLCTFLVAERDGKTSGGRGLHLRWLSMPRLDISSSTIRQRLRRGQSVRYLLPKPVEQYVTRRRLYQSSG